ncbi:MAG TPA: winged helix-turn-helix domain-containing protein [Pyrinomonadaceae bacterium]|nr:winged helix-turn-helix domain-containing protein [Pyrinomonadaceae bacterium]
MESQGVEAYEFDSFRMELVSRRLLRDGQPVRLTTKDFDILLLLVSNRGRVVTKEELMGHVWPEQFVEENNLTVRVSALRKLLGESHERARYIQTVQGRGYRFVAKVRAVGAVRAGQVGRPAPDMHRAVSSLAVLPLGLIAVDPHEKYLGQGIADAIITKLGKIRRLRVPPTTAILRYSKPEIDLQEIGHKLGVDSVLTGQVQKVGERIRVTVQLTSTQRWQVLWAEKFDESFTNIFAVEDRVSERVANTLVQGLSPGEQRILSRRYTNSTEAYRSYLEGRYFWNKRTEDGFKKGIRCFQQAINFDPQFALGHAGIALCYNLLASYGLLPPSECIPRTREAAARALELDETVADAHVALGHVKLMHDWDLPGAEEHLRRATELDTNNPTAHHWYSLYLRCLGRFDEALAALGRAHELDPLSLIIKTAVAGTYYFARQYEVAILKFREVLDLDPNFAPAYSILSLSYAHRGMYEEAIAAARKSVAADTNPEALVYLGFVHAMSGNRGAAMRVLAKLKKASKHQAVWSSHMAAIYSALGEKEQAFALLEKAYEERNLSMVALRVDQRFDNLRSDPRFAALVRRMGLTE